MTTERDLISHMVAVIADAHDECLDGMNTSARERLMDLMREGNAYLQQTALAAPVAPAGIAPKDCVWARNGHQVCPSSPVAPALVPMTRASSQQVESNAVKCCTNRVDHPSTFILGWRAAEAFHGIKP